MNEQKNMLWLYIPDEGVAHFATYLSENEVVHTLQLNL